MKANELMIGDWVRIGENDKYSGCVGKIITLHQDEGAYFFVFVNGDKGVCTTEVFNEDIEPIPLTAEILEKNFQEFLPGINLMYQLKGPYCAMNEDGQWVFGLVKVDGENSGRYPLVKILFVHQLQHALRLCGIEKEITI